MYIWNYNDQTVVKSFEVTELPGAPLCPALCPTRTLGEDVDTRQWEACALTALRA